MRLAWFSPFPPVRTGIADCSAELVGALRARGYDIDGYPVEAAHDFPWRHRQQPYDLVVYQFGNSSHHEYEWAYALRYAGLVVLHDTQLHHARAAFLLRERRAADYRAEFAWSHADVSADAAELAIAGLDSRLFYRWDMVRGLLETARLVAVHGEGARRELIASTPHVRLGYDAHANSEAGRAEKIVSIRLGHGRFVGVEERLSARQRIRAKLGIADNAVLFGVFGGLTPEKRIPQVLDAMRRIAPHAPSARLLLAGAAAAHYDVQGGIAVHGLQDRVTLAGYLSEDDLTAHLAACDVSVNLRWPTARETSGAWLRALAAGLPTIVTDLAHMDDVPSLDPRTWVSRASTLQPPSSGLQPPVCVAIDILDEDHSLRLAMRRLAQDAELRERLGRAAHAWWQREHSLDVMVEDYVRLIERAVTCSAGALPEDAPPHLRSDGDGRLRTLLAPFGLDVALVP